MTIRQKQCLMCYLGYYDGLIDGLWGPKSQQAVIRFQCSRGMEPSGLFNEETEREILKTICEEDWWEEIRYFTREEFACKCGKFCNGYPAEPRRTLVKLADQARAHFGAPAMVISGLRCKQHNANVGGVENSQHMYGEAVDIKIRGVSADTLLAYLQKQPGVRYAYKINETNVHFDIPKGSR